VFIDQVTIRVRSGAGGAGCVAFRREKYVPKGGPSGGNGGKGGDVVLRADSQLHPLLDHRYRKVYYAEDGAAGASSRTDGRWGADLVGAVPCGTLVKDADTDEIVADLVEEGQEARVAVGGRGGRGNAEFATPTRRTPRFAEPGQEGVERSLSLELKLIADVGLLGMPNAGKSTLISVITAARPKIADYPFTTLEPNLGIVRYKEYESFTVADLPGLIEGAHTGKGLGHLFLRHLERTRVIALLIDCGSEDYPQVYEMLRHELAAYSRELARKPHVVALSKIDAADENFQERSAEFAELIGRDVTSFSSVSGEGIPRFLDLLWNMLEVERGGPAVESS